MIPFITVFLIDSYKLFGFFHIFFIFHIQSDNNYYNLLEKIFLLSRDNWKIHQLRNLQKYYSNKYRVENYQQVQKNWKNPWEYLIKVMYELHRLTLIFFEWRNKWCKYNLHFFQWLMTYIYFADKSAILYVN